MAAIQQARPEVIPPVAANAQPAQAAAQPNQATKPAAKETKSMQPYQFLMGTALATAMGAAAVGAKLITGISIGGGALFGLYAGLIGQGMEYLISKAIDLMVPANYPVLRVISKVALCALAFGGAGVLAAMWATAVGFPVTSTLALGLSVAAAGVLVNICPWIHHALRAAMDHAREEAAKPAQPQQAGANQPQPAGAGQPEQAGAGQGQPQQAGAGQ